MQPRKQRKYLANAPLHVRQKMMSVHLEDKLAEKVGKRSLPVRKGDEVKVMRGKRRGIKAKVAEVNLKDLWVYLEGQTRSTIKGAKVLVPFAPSKLLLTSIIEDKRRNRQGKKIVKKKQEKTEKPAEKKPAEKTEKLKESPKKEEKK